MGQWGQEQEQQGLLEQEQQGLLEQEQQGQLQELSGSPQPTGSMPRRCRPGWWPLP